MHAIWCIPVQIAAMVIGVCIGFWAGLIWSRARFRAATAYELGVRGAGKARVGSDCARSLSYGSPGSPIRRFDDFTNHASRIPHHES